MNFDDEVLQQIQDHGDIAFMQGYNAALSGISFNDRIALRKMEEAHKRLSIFDKIYRKLASKNKCACTERVIE